MKVGDIVRFKKGAAPFHPFRPDQRGIVVADDSFTVDVYWYKGSKMAVSELKEFLEVVSESR